MERPGQGIRGNSYLRLDLFEYLRAPDDFTSNSAFAVMRNFLVIPVVVGFQETVKSFESRRRGQTFLKQEF